MNKILKLSVIVFFISFIKIHVVAQEAVGANEDAAYTKVITQRADKIVAKLAITDSLKYKRVVNIIANQYSNLNTHHENRNTALKSAKDNLSNDKSVLESKQAAINADADKQLKNIHDEYISRLSSELSHEQIVKVKDGMTYGVVPITYKGYNEMLPNLTDVQKETILNFLIEARDHAMDAPSSDKKHWWFGKYKGKINNYLSAQGIDMNKASKEWQERIKAEKSAGSKK